MAKRVPKTSKHRLIALSPFIILIIGYFLFTAFYYGYKLISLKNEQIRLSNDLLNLQSKEKSLKNEIQKLKDPDYLARYARENFLYSKDGEYVIRLDNKDSNQIKKNSFLQILEERYYIAIISSMAILVFIIITFKIKRNRIKHG